MYDLITSGCSFTKQSFLNKTISKYDFNSYSWSEWIEHDKGLKTLNLGNQTNDNISICRTILHYLDEINPKMVFIQWSAESRYPFFIGDFEENEMHTLNYVKKDGYSFGLTGSGIGDNLEVGNHNNFGRLSTDFLTLNDKPINQVLHWFEIWSFLITEFDKRGIIRKYFSMERIDYDFYLNNPLFKSYKNQVQKELELYNSDILSAIDYCNELYKNENKLKDYLLEGMECVIFTELYKENPSKDFFELELKKGNRVGGHPSSVVYRKFINEELFL